MVSRLSILAPVASALLLAGCSGNGYRGLESQHQPVVSRSEYAIDLATQGNSLAPGEAQRLAGWMGSMRLGYGDRVYVDDPTGYAPAARDVVATEASRYGLLLSDTAPVTPGPIADGTVRVVVTRMRASVPDCPKYDGAEEFNFNGHTSANYGCATNSNLAAMVARPEDLVRGQAGADTSDTDSAIKAITTYREAKPTGADGLKTESTQSGGSN
ncbi:CpaD family pilus assembly protein [Stakelama marina]|uniref:CpaD family pilus assembly protein n=1 Tax=Stakelama marina TaxID=2826939 RepID=A0A8T4IJL9_9SPHN|nr:CpaD family pilus assembly protein [Stakelama marina]MBR0552366.1 CpaD family pilus assembly protein [Stakelama marina]